ncbi:MAG TPA: FmdB family zinc ribbon protein [Candidatus Acidoferrales bacterium]|nr:FmdB family zinc ribbon protein [Candidatus Acidoferrales bacterium]
MPLYDYRCEACGKVTEIRHGFNETNTKPCSHCGGAMVRVFNPAPIIFNGSGFYVTDSRPAAKSDSSPPPSDSPSSSKSDSAA